LSAPRARARRARATASRATRARPRPRANAVDATRARARGDATRARASRATMARRCADACEPRFARCVRDGARDVARTRNPRERACAVAPRAIARTLDRCVWTYAAESARAAALRDARRDAARATVARPDARALLVLLGQAIEMTDRRRRGTLVVIGACAREGRRRAERLRAYAEANEWTATELESARAEEARAIGTMKRALAMSERDASATLEAIVGGRLGGEAENRRGRRARGRGETSRERGAEKFRRITGGARRRRGVFGRGTDDDRGRAARGSVADGDRVDATDAAGER
jgi:hypothetical protein